MTFNTIPSVAISTREQFFNSAEDIAWLHATHLKGINSVFESFVLVGNEDCPEAVYLYRDADPLVTDKARIINLMAMQEAA